jgi:ATP-dependent DNA helicase RecG
LGFASSLLWIKLLEPFPQGVSQVVLKNVNYLVIRYTAEDTAEDTAQDNQQDNQQVSIQEMILQYCAIPRGRKEITEHCGYKDMRHFSSNFLKPLLESGRLQMTLPDKPCG